MDELTAGAPAVRVPGIRLAAPAARDRYGTVWRGVEAGSGRPVTVRIGRRAGALLDEEQATAQVRLVSRWRRVDPAHVARLHRMLDLPAGVRVLVLDDVPGDNLADLLTGAALAPAAAVTLGVGVARGLAQLHAVGLVHGRLSVASVAVSAHGRPMLVDAGLAVLLEPLLEPLPEPHPELPVELFPEPRSGLPGSPVAAEPVPAEPTDADRAADVRALGRLVLRALGDAPDDAEEGLAAVRLAAERCAEADPGSGPDPREAEDLLVAAWPPEPLTGPAGAQPPATLPEPDQGRPATAGVRERPPAAGSLPPVVVRAVPRLRLPGARSPAGTAAAVLAAVLAAVAAGVVGVHGGPDDPGVPTARGAPAAPVAAVEVTASRQPSVVEVLEAMRAAARARARAFATADLEPLAAADVPGSPAARADRQVVEGLIRAGLRLRGLAFAVDRVTIEGAPHDPDRSGGSGGGGSRDVVATATVTTSAHEQVADGGALVRRVGPRGPELVRVVLSPSGGRWRLRSVDPVGSSSRVSRR